MPQQDIYLAVSDKNKSANRLATYIHQEGFALSSIHMWDTKQSSK